MSLDANFSLLAVCPQRRIDRISKEGTVCAKEATQFFIEAKFQFPELLLVVFGTSHDG
jgi:hypothetical protein